MKNVLVIEDNDNNMALICFILEHAGFQVIRAVTGKEGIKLAADILPDFIIQDIQLPDITGDDVIGILRNDKKTAAIPIIAMTSYAMTGDREKLLAQGCAGYIEKPIDPDRILEQIESILKSIK